jgi:hypothetical protein
MRLIRIAECLAWLLLANLRQLVTGLPEEPSSEAKSWSEKAIDVIVMKETPDAGGRHISCVATSLFIACRFQMRLPDGRIA